MQNIFCSSKCSQRHSWQLLAQRARSDYSNLKKTWIGFFWIICRIQNFGLYWISTFETGGYKVRFWGTCQSSLSQNLSYKISVFQFFCCKFNFAQKKKSAVIKLVIYVKLIWKTPRGAQGRERKKGEEEEAAGWAAAGEMILKKKRPLGLKQGCM